MKHDEKWWNMVVEDGFMVKHIEQWWTIYGVWVGYWEMGLGWEFYIDPQAVTSQAATKTWCFSSDFLYFFVDSQRWMMDDDGDNCNTVQQFNRTRDDSMIVVLFSVVYDKPWMNDAWLNTWGRVETMTYFGNESILVPSLIGWQAILCFSWAWIAHIRVLRHSV